MCKTFFFVKPKQRLCYVLEFTITNYSTSYVMITARGTVGWIIANIFEARNKKSRRFRFRIVLLLCCARDRGRACCLRLCDREFEIEMN